MTASACVPQRPPDPQTQQFTWNTVGPVPQILMDSNSEYIYNGGLSPL